MSRRRRRISNEVLVKQYCIDRLSCGEIGRLHGLARSSIHKRLKRLGVQTRNPKQAMKNRENRNIRKEKDIPFKMLVDEYGNDGIDLEEFFPDIKSHMGRVESGEKG
jgi:predicted DNA-binding protein YlxM (UPF0122 family)